MKNALKYMALICFIAFTASCSNKSDTPDFEIFSVRKTSIRSSILATGIIKPKIGAEVRVGSRASGIVKRLYVKNGDTVKKGELLAKLDDSELLSRYRLEAANLDNVLTISKYAKTEMDIAKSLNEKDFTSVQAYENMVKEYDISMAKVASQKAALDYAITQLGYARIVAPISGIVSSVSTQEGETVSAAFTAPTFVTIIDLSRIEVWTYVDETDIGKVDSGQKVNFTVDTYTGTTFEGLVTAIYPKAEIRDNVVNYIVVVEILDRKGKILRPEMTASVTIQTSPSNKVISIPNNAIKRRNGESIVYLLKNEETVIQGVKTGLKGDQMTEILEGIKENDRIIINPEELTIK